MILNSQIWLATVEAARAAQMSAEWQRALAKAIERLPKLYWRFDGDYFIVQSASDPAEGGVYAPLHRVNGVCDCRAAQRGHAQCWHRAAKRLAENYRARLS